MRTVNRSIVFVLCVIALVAITNDAAAQAGGRISGKVEDQAGNPIEGVQVTAISPSLDSFKAEKTTNKKGKFVIAFTDSTASYVIELKKEGYQTIVAPINPVPGQTRMVEYVLLPAEGNEQAADERAAMTGASIGTGKAWASTINTDLASFRSKDAVIAEKSTALINGPVAIVVG